MGAVTTLLCAKEFDKKDIISCIVSGSGFSNKSSNSLLVGMNEINGYNFNNLY